MTFVVKQTHTQAHTHTGTRRVSMREAARTLTHAQSMQSKNVTTSKWKSVRSFCRHFGCLCSCCRRCSNSSSIIAIHECVFASACRPTHTHRRAHVVTKIMREMTNTLELLLCVCGACLFCCFFTLLHASLSSSRIRSNNNKRYSNTLCLIFVVSFLTHDDCFLSFCIICRLFLISFHV